MNLINSLKVLQPWLHKLAKRLATKVQQMMQLRLIPKTFLIVQNFECIDYEKNEL